MIIRQSIEVVRDEAGISNPADSLDGEWPEEVLGEGHGLEALFAAARRGTPCPQAPAGAAEEEASPDDAGDDPASRLEGLQLARGGVLVASRIKRHHSERESFEWVELTLRLPNGGPFVTVEIYAELESRSVRVTKAVVVRPPTRRALFRRDDARPRRRPRPVTRPYPITDDRRGKRV